jgi:cytoskeletal protein RodZ
MAKNSQKNLKRSWFSDRRLWLVGLAIVLAGGLLFWGLKSGNSGDNALDLETGKSGIRYEPPTDEEKQQAEDHKDDLAQQNNNPAPAPSTPNAKKSVTPVITNVDNSGLRGYVPGVIEDGGTCTATAKSGSATVTKTSSGFANVSYTQCAPITWDSQLASGTWEFTLSYQSAKAEGQYSQTKNL